MWLILKTQNKRLPQKGINNEIADFFRDCRAKFQY